MENSYEQYAVRNRGLDAKKAVLLVTCRSVSEGLARPILPANQATTDLARGAHIPVIFSHHSHRGPQDYGMLHKWEGDLIKAGSADAELMPKVRKLESDKLVPKHTYNAFQRHKMGELSISDREYRG